MTSGVVFLAANLVPVAAVATMLVVRRPPHPAPWYLITGALLSSTVHNIVWLVQVPIQGQAQSTGLLSTMTLLLAYVGLLVAAVLVVIPVARGDGGAVVDSSIVSVSVAGLLWSLVLAPALDAQGAGAGTRALSLVIVLLVCGTTGAVARAAITAREARPTLGYLLLAAVAMLVATVVSATTETTPGVPDGGLKDFVWIIAYLALGAAAAHPSRAALRTPGRPLAQTLTLPHLLVLGVAVCSNLLLAGVLELTGTGSDPALLIVGSLVVVPLFLVRVWQIAGLFEKAQDDLVRQARHDDLTGLPNRRAATAHLEETVRGVDDGTLAGARVCFLDLDDFKLVNDEHGHGTGDQVLVQVAERLAGAVRHEDFVARLGGDEFVVVLPCDGDDLETLTVDRVRDAVSAPMDISGATIVVDVSIGSVAVTRGEGVTVERLLSFADARMYLDKRRERVTSPRSAPVGTVSPVSLVRSSSGPDEPDGPRHS
ncbi:GGDEF domain-containing protein [Sanguibacter sp. 25GB23B1]|uniref:GGDEF domain-containing protein n=1 Tax=Sanguibacter sp. 25GB23B1 TaxID=3156067 RepID=UPI0032AEC7C6